MSSLLRFKNHVERIRAEVPGIFAKLFAPFLELEKITPAPGSRSRLFPEHVTLASMLEQALLQGTLQHGKQMVQAAHAARQTGVEVGNTTSSYCNARKRLRQSTLDATHRRICDHAGDGATLLGGRRVWVIDGTGVQLLDTPANQAEYPQPTNQKDGCGQPVVQIVALLNLNTGLLEHTSLSPHTAHEGSMGDVFLVPYLQPGDMLIADCGFSSYIRYASLLARQIDSLMPLHASRTWPSAAKGDDIRVTWKRPGLSTLPDHITDAAYEALPREMTVRYIRKTIILKGYRPRTLILVTTDLDTPSEELFALYLRRWSIELVFDDIKTHLGMDLIAAKTPEMAHKIISCHLMAHNLIRLYMSRATATYAQKENARPISFAGTLTSLLTFGTQLVNATPQTAAAIHDKLLAAINKNRVPIRPQRIEPRVRKRRPKPFPLMTQKRALIRDQIRASMKDSSTHTATHDQAA